MEAHRSEDVDSGTLYGQAEDYYCEGPTQGRHVDRAAEFVTGTGVQRKVALLCLVAAMALTGACDSMRSADSSPSKPRPGQSSSNAVSDGKAEKAILDQAFVGRNALGSGSGRLQSQIGNTLPATPKGVLSVTFAFACTGHGKAAFNFTASGKNAPSAARTSICDGSIFQQSLKVPESGPISFEAEVTGSKDGGFAYSYYTEKKQLS